MTTMDFFSEWLEELGIKSKVTVMESNKLTNTILEGEYDTFQWGWYVEPDPNSILDDFTCAQRGGWSDSWYCNPEYDALMKQQKGEVDDEKRVDQIKQMQQILFEDSPYLVVAYTATARPTAATGSPASCRSRSPTACCSCSTAPTTTACCGRRKDAGDCDGVARADGREQQPRPRPRPTTTVAT